MAFFQLFPLSLDKQMPRRANKKYNDIINTALCLVCFVSILAYVHPLSPSFQTLEFLSLWLFSCFVLRPFSHIPVDTQPTHLIVVARACVSATEAHVFRTARC